MLKGRDDAANRRMTAFTFQKYHRAILMHAMSYFILSGDALRRRATGHHALSARGRDFAEERQAKCDRLRFGRRMTMSAHDAAAIIAPLAPFS